MTLVDTHVLLWLTLAPQRLGKRARRAVEKAVRDGSVAASALSFCARG
jgi:PIN domain nuclease of toxin-antitoxin system